MNSNGRSPVYEADNPDVPRAKDGHRLTKRHREVRKGVNDRYAANEKARAAEEEQDRIEKLGGLLLPLAEEPDNLPVVGGEPLTPVRWAAFVAYAIHASNTKALNWLLSKGYMVSPSEFYSWCNEPWMRQLARRYLDKAQEEFKFGLARLKGQAIEAGGEILAGARSEDRSVNAQAQILRALMEAGPDPAINRQKQITINNQTNVGVAVAGAVDIAKMKRELTPDQIARYALPDSDIPAEYRRVENPEE